MTTKMADRIDPFTAKASVKSKKQKRSQGSSHYRANTAPELQALPHLKGLIGIFIYYFDSIFKVHFISYLETCVFDKPYLNESDPPPPPPPNVLAFHRALFDFQFIVPPPDSSRSRSSTFEKQIV